jgi:hypothetical protein
MMQDKGRRKEGRTKTEKGTGIDWLKSVRSSEQHGVQYCNGGWRGD